MRFCWAQYGLWAVILGLGILTLVAGCGAKGDLFLPPEEKAAVQSPASPPTEAAQPQPEDESPSQ